MTHDQLIVSIVALAILIGALRWVLHGALVNDNERYGSVVNTLDVPHQDERYNVWASKFFNGRPRERHAGFQFHKRTGRKLRDYRTRTA